jgi:pSer/pThr/pTyr-binding forkhead associated (FHA) protein
MKLKSFISKIIPGKKEKEPPPSPGQESPDVIDHEIGINKMQTRIETKASVAEIDVYVNNEKTNIHTLAAQTRIGRDPSQADIIISELIVSKLHCTIYSLGPNYFIRDEKSTNGVYLNNEKVHEHNILNGDTIMLGKKGTVKIIFHKR